MHTIELGLDLMLYGLLVVFLALFILYGFIRLFSWILKKNTGHEAPEE